MISIKSKKVIGNKSVSSENQDQIDGKAKGEKNSRMIGIIPKGTNKCMLEGGLSSKHNPRPQIAPSPPILCPAPEHAWSKKAPFASARENHRQVERRQTTFSPRLLLSSLLLTPSFDHIINVMKSNDSLSFLTSFTNTPFSSRSILVRVRSLLLLLITCILWLLLPVTLCRVLWLVVLPISSSHLGLLSLLLVCRLRRRLLSSSITGCLLVRVCNSLSLGLVLLLIICRYSRRRGVGCLGLLL
mmetsp:Transcript_32968/g.44646  ORF Transcript_32968/g.44646 Transcript_32968/m.44646 type:complete len:243 (+) Transcript_32968:1490-2218(+)